MKKQLAWLLAVLLLFSLTSCGAQKTPDTTEDGTAAALGDEKTETNWDFERGTVENGVYTNRFAKIQMAIPDGWETAGDEQLQEMMSLGSELMDEDALSKKLAEVSTIYDQMFSDPATGNNIIITFENLLLSGGDRFDESGYIDVLIPMLEKQTAIQYTIGEKGEFAAGDGVFATLTVTARNGDTEMEQKYYAKKIGHYMANIIITSVDGTAISEYEALFRA